MTVATETERTSIRCPHCGQRILLDEAIAHQLAEPMRAGWEAELRQAIDSEVRSAYAHDLQEQREHTDELTSQLKERDQKIKELRDGEAQLLRDRRKLEDDKDDLEREKERMRDDIRKQEREAADKRAAERAADDLHRARGEFQEKLAHQQDESETRARQLEEQLRRVNAQLEEVQRKSGIGSRQQEGVARQDVFAQELRERFPDDLISVTGVGKRGPDVTQVVRLGRLECGVILWECKRTAAWGPEWPRKLAGEVRGAGARFGVIVSDVLPSGTDGSGQVGDVWACDYAHAWHLAAGLRQAIIAVHRHETANAARTGIAEKVYDYIATGGFESRYKAMEQAIDRIAAELDTDQRASQQRWKRLEKLVTELRDQGLDGIVLDILGLGGEIPPAARAELPGETTLSLTTS